MNNKNTHENLQLLQHLAHNGPCTVAQLLAFVHESRPALNIRLTTLEARGWLKKQVSTKNTKVWSIHPAAHPQLTAMGISIEVCADPVQKQAALAATQAHAPTLVQPARRNIYEAPVWKGWGNTSCTRAGAYDFKALPSRGFSC